MSKSIDEMIEEAKKEPPLPFECYEIWRPNIPDNGCSTQCKECREEQENEEIEYEIGIHDCGFNGECNRYRSCGYEPRPIPSNYIKGKVVEKVIRDMRNKGYASIDIESRIKTLFK